MALGGWGALLQGRAQDLEDWRLALKPGFDPWLQVRGDDFILRSMTLDPLSDAVAVRDRAIALIDLLNGALAISERTQPVRFSHAVQFDDKGAISHKIALAAASFTLDPVKLRAVGVALGPDGQALPPPPPTPTTVQAWAAVAEANDALADVLTYCGRTLNWFDIYKAIECLCDFAGGEPELLAKGWAPKNEIKRMKQTANFARHARAVRPKDPMPIDDARVLLAHLARSAFGEVTS